MPRSCNWADMTYRRPAPIPVAPTSPIWLRTSHKVCNVVFWLPNKNKEPGTSISPKKSGVTLSSGNYEHESVANRGSASITNLVVIQAQYLQSVLLSAKAHLHLKTHWYARSIKTSTEIDAETRTPGHFQSRRPQHRQCGCWKRQAFAMSCFGWQSNTETHWAHLWCGAHIGATVELLVGGKQHTWGGHKERKLRHRQFCWKKYLISAGFCFGCEFNTNTQYEIRKRNILEVEKIVVSMTHLRAPPSSMAPASPIWLLSRHIVCRVLFLLIIKHKVALISPIEGTKESVLSYLRPAPSPVAPASQILLFSRPSVSRVVFWLPAKHQNTRW